VPTTRAQKGLRLRLRLRRAPPRQQQRVEKAKRQLPREVQPLLPPPALGLLVPALGEGPPLSKALLVELALGSVSCPQKAPPEGQSWVVCFAELAVRERGKGRKVCVCVCVWGGGNQRSNSQLCLLTKRQGCWKV